MSRSRFKYEKTFPIFRMSDVSNFRLLISIWDLISLLETNLIVRREPYAVWCVPRAMWGPIIVTLQLYCVSANAFIGKDDCIHDRSLVVILQIDNFRMVHRVLIRHLFLIELSFSWFLNGNYRWLQVKRLAIVLYVTFGKRRTKES